MNPLIRITADGRELEAEQGKSVLEACLDNGIYIPHLCHHNALHPIGVCRLCVVETEGVDGLQVSCATQVEDGMSIRTVSGAINAARRMSIELMLSGHQADCGTCVKYLNCELQALKQYLVADELRVARRSRLFGTTETNPLFDHEPNKCVLCGRCVRACRDLGGTGVLYYKHDHGETYIGVGPDPSHDVALAEAGCRFCGICAEVCPTGAVLDRDGLMQNKTRKEALLPCANTCPAEIDVPRYLRFIKEGDAAAALAVIREKVPFPRVLGYVCSHPCEDNCRRGRVSQPIAICRLKRYASENGEDAEAESGWTANLRKKPETGKRAAVIGAGPAGLTAAFYLKLLGHAVTVFEEQPEPGGMLRYGIPEYRLPREVTETEIRHIIETGVEIRTGVRIESVDVLLDEGFDSVLIAIGAHKGVRLRLPGAKGEGVYTSVDFLRAARAGTPPKELGRVIVLGGGSVAFDSARVALRLGAGEVSLVCLETADMLPAPDEEIAEGADEGVRIYPSESFRMICRDGGIVTGVECDKVSSLTFSDDNVPVIETVPDSGHVITADTVIFAVGQKPGVPENFGVGMTDRGFIDADRSTLATDMEGVFAVSDAVTGTDKVISAIAAGRKAAQVIDKYLGGRGRPDQNLAPSIEPEPEPGAFMGNAGGFAALKRAPAVKAPADERIQDFRVVEYCANENDALFEAGRCLQCDRRLKIKAEKFWSGY